MAKDLSGGHWEKTPFTRETALSTDHNGYQVFTVDHWEIRLCSHGRLIFLKAKGLSGVKVEKLGGGVKKTLSSHGRVLFLLILRPQRFRGVHTWLQGTDQQFVLSI